MKILNLYAGIGGNRKLWGDNHDITAVELVPEVKFGRNKLRPEQLKFKNTCIENRVLWAEIRSFEQFKQTLQKWGLYDPEKDKPKFFGAQQSQPQLDINKIFKRWRDE